MQVCSCDLKKLLFCSLRLKTIFKLILFSKFYISEVAQWIGWMVRDLERSQFFQLVRKTSGKEVCVDGSLQMGKGFGDSGVSCKCSKGDFNGEAQQPSR